MERRNVLLILLAISWQIVFSQEDSLMQDSLKQDILKLENITTLRQQYEIQNRLYSKRYWVKTDKEELPKDSIIQDQKESILSSEAYYWINYKREESDRIPLNYTYRDTVISDPIFLPLLFKGKYFPEDLSLYDKSISISEYIPKPIISEKEVLSERLRQLSEEDMAYMYVQNNYPWYFKHTIFDLPTDQVKTKIIKKDVFKEKPFEVVKDATFDDVSAPKKFIPERRYWTSNFESAVQLSQNYISENWHKGGISNFNLVTNNMLKYNFNRNKVKINNELELSVNVATNKEDTMHSYKVNADVLRLHTNVGLQAYNHWYYTADIEAKTQVMTQYARNSDSKELAFLAPLWVNVGLGMKYDITLTEFKTRHRKIAFSTNIAPFSINYAYSKDDDINFGKYGFKKKEGTDIYENNFLKFGFTLRTDLGFQINRTTNWVSRFYYFTSYDRIVGEFENTFTFALSRFFSTRLYFHLRYDDGVDLTYKDEEKTRPYSRFQLNELFSFGFNYKW